MRGSLELGYRRLGRFVAPLGLAAAVTFTGGLSVLAQDADFSGGEQVGGDAYEYAESPYAVVYEDQVYEYATGKDGKGYYSVYDGDAYSEWSGWDEQPADFQYKPAASVSGEWNYVFYTGADGHIYQNGYDGESWQGWEDLSGNYAFKQAPYAHEYDGTVYLYAVADDDNLYYKSYEGDGGYGAGWSEWAAANDGYAAGDYQPYAVEWGEYNNVFWTGTDGKVYWNRYDGTEWTGAKALAGDGEYGYAPYAVGYEEQLYAYAVSSDGVPYYNVFDGDGWAGWSTYEQEPPATYQYQPSAYVYEDKQHVVYTGDDGHGYYTSYDGDAWSDWVDLGENYAYDPYQYEYADNLYLTYTGTDSYIYVKPHAASGEEDGGY